MPKNKVLPHPVLTRGLNLDTPHPSLLLAALLSQREDKQLQKSTTLSTTVQLSQPSQHIHLRNYTTSQSMQDGMRILSGTRQTVPPEAPGAR